MSSFIAHSLVGFTIASRQKYFGLKEGLIISCFFMVLASMPDVDYLINYLRGESMPIRYTHSISYVFVVGLLALVFRNIVLKRYLYGIPIILFFLAPFSHLLLDFLVGVHENPYFYPFSSELMVSPIGILPSAGRIDIHNHYFWRNIFIELAIFIPILFASAPRFRKVLRTHKFLILFLLLIFCTGVYIGFNLERG